MNNGSEEDRISSRDEMENGAMKIRDLTMAIEGR